MEGLLEPGRWRLRWAMIMPLHCSLGNRVRLCLKNEKKKSKRKYGRKEGMPSPLSWIPYTCWDRGLTALSFPGLHPGSAECWGVSQVHPQEQRQHAQCRQPHSGTRATSERSVRDLPSHQSLQRQPLPEIYHVPSFHTISNFLLLLLRNENVWCGMV